MIHIPQDDEFARLLAEPLSRNDRLDSLVRGMDPCILVCECVGWYADMFGGMDLGEEIKSCRAATRRPLWITSQVDELNRNLRFVFAGQIDDIVMSIQMLPRTMKDYGDGDTKGLLAWKEICPSPCRRGTSDF